MRVQSGQPGTLDKQQKNSTLATDTGSELSIADVFKMLARHKWFIAICVLVCSAISLAYIKIATPIYEATASIRIDPGRAGSLGLAELTGFGITDPAEELATEIAIIKSDTVAIDTLNSLSDEEFKRYTGKAKEGLIVRPGATDLTADQEALLTKFKGQLTASQLLETQLVSISFKDKNPQIAGLIVNHTIQSYLKQSFDSRYGSVTQVKQWLSTEMDKLREQAAQAQRKLADFQEANNILATDAGPATPSSGSSSNTTTDRLSLLNSRLTQAQADRIVKEAQMRAAASGSPAVLSSLFPTPTLTALEADQSRLYAQYVQLSSKFAANYPPLVEVKNQMQKVDAELEVEVSTIRKRLKQEFDASVTVEEMLQKQYDLQTDKAYILNRKQAEYAILRVEGTSSRDLYNTLQVKLQQAGVDAGLNGVSTMMVDSARTPHLAVEPKKAAILSFGVVLGLFAGIASAFLLEATSDKLQSVEQAEHTLGAHLLSAIPHANLAQAEQASAGPPGKQAIPAMLVALKDPLSRQAEAYRTLRNAVLLSSIDSSPKTVLVTSTIAGEGKSSTAANYAVVLAQNGAKVLLIDADLRRPTLHQKFGVSNKIGLSNLILGEPSVNPFLTPFTELENLSLLTAGKKVPLPSEALGSTKFFSLLQEWEKQFDHVIIDSAPLLIVSDSLPMASWVDALILVTRYNFTPVSALKRIRVVLNHTNARVAGMILNDMPGKNGGYYGSYVDAYYR